MTRSEFWEWMGDCPSENWEITLNDIGRYGDSYTIIFTLEEDEDEEEKAQASLVLVRELAVLEASSKTKKSACLAAHSPQVINKKNKVRK